MSEASDVFDEYSNWGRYSVATGSDHVVGAQQWAGKPLPRKMGYADDTVVLHLQSATHWDSLAHIFHDGSAYNGVPAAEVSNNGAARLGSEKLKDSLVGRGVLLDVPRARGRDWLDDGYPITVDDLEPTAERERVTIGAGDILLLRTGQMARCREQGWGTYAGGDAPGLSFFTIPWLAETGVAAVAKRHLGCRGPAERAAGQLPALPHPGARLHGAPARRDVRLRAGRDRVRGRRRVRDARVRPAAPVHGNGGGSAGTGRDPLVRVY